MTHTCALRCCGRAIEEAAAKVATTANVRGLVRALKARNTTIDWQLVGPNTGDAYFHRACFDGLERALEAALDDSGPQDAKRAKRGDRTGHGPSTVVENGVRRSGRLRAKKTAEEGSDKTEPQANTAASSSSATSPPSSSLPPLRGRERSVFATALETAEFTDSLSDIEAKAAAVAALIKDWKANGASICFFTGAGISTNAGIGDYRGRKGKWTEEDTGVHADEEEGIDYEALRPTYTHEAIAKMVEDGLADFVVTQNCDCLHELSGVPANRMAELHGNVFIEACSRCGVRYMRPYYVLDDEAEAVLESGTVPKGSHIEACPTCGLNHYTGRTCTQQQTSGPSKGKACKGKLKDTIINFGDLLEEPILDAATAASNSARLMISLGSSMTVTPASMLVARARNLVVVNRQRTDYDKKAAKTARVFADTDTFMRLLMKHLLSSSERAIWEEHIRTAKRAAYDKARRPNAKTIVLPPLK